MYNFNRFFRIFFTLGPRVNTLATTRIRTCFKVTDSHNFYENTSFIRRQKINGDL